MRPFVLAALLAASLAGGAHADPAPLVDCGYESQLDPTMTYYYGTAYGYVASTVPGENVSIRCYVRVDGIEASATPTGTGTTVAVTHGQVAFAAAPEQEVAMCAEWTRGADSGTNCTVSTTIYIPPQEVFDLLADLGDELGFDPTYADCFVLAALAPGVPGVVDVDAEGDVAIAGETLWDCPPYGSST